MGYACEKIINIYILASVSQTMFHIWLLSTIIHRVMGFLFKQPSVLLQILCALHCPLHDVSHDIDDFLLYYNLLYYP